MGSWNGTDWQPDFRNKINAISMKFPGKNRKVKQFGKVV